MLRSGGTMANSSHGPMLLSALNALLLQEKCKQLHLHFN
jgi:hypothetical protein